MAQKLLNRTSLRALCTAAAVGGSILVGSTGAFAQSKAAASASSIEDAIQSRMNLRGAAVVKLDVADALGVAQQVVVPFAGQLLTLDMQPFSVRAEGYKLWEQRADGLWYEMDPGPVSTLRGSVLEFPGSIVAGGLVNGGLMARVILPDDREFWIEPVDPEAGAPGSYVIYTPDNLIRGDFRCGNTEMPDRPAPKQEEGGMGQRGVTLYTAQLATDADFEYFTRWGGTTWVNQRISAITNTMNVAYERDVNITHVISQSVIRTSSADPYTTTDPATLNAQIQTEWNGNAGTRDAIQLFTGREIDGSVIGRANAIGSICSAGNGASNCYSQSDFNNNFMSACDLSQHELGHLWDATHCTCSNPASTMNPSITSINRFTFSTNNNIGQIVAYRNGRGCLTTAGTGGPPRNNDCSDAVPISTGRFGFNNDDATTDGPAACGLIADDVWFTYRAPCDGTLSIDTCNNANEVGFDTVLVAYSGSCGNLTQLACNDDDTGCTVSSPARRSLITFPVDRNVLYYIRVGGYNGANGEGILDVDLTQSCPPVPSNDDCPNAINITECSGTIALNNRGAQSDGFLEHSDCNFSSSSTIFDDLWYRVVAPCTGTMRVSSCGSAIDTKIAIYLSCPTVANGAFTCNDDNGPACTGLDASVEFATIGGNDYYIRIGSYSDLSEGNIDLSISALACPIPANDSCLAPTAVTTGLSNINNINACNNTPSGCGSGAAAVYYSFVAPDSCTYTVETCGLATWDTVVAVYASCFSTTAIACSDDNCGGTLQSSLSFSATAGTSYLIRVAGFGGATGTGQMRITGAAPANDLCAGAETVGLGTTPIQNHCAGGEGANACGSGLASVFYRFTSPLTGPLNIDTCSPDRNYDTVMGVYVNCAANTPIACSDDACGLGSRLTINAVLGTTYIIRVHGFGGSTGEATLHIGPDNDECPSPSVISSGVNIVSINGATQSGPAIGCRTPFADVWLTYTADCSGDVTIDTCANGTTFDTVLAAFRGTACPVTQARQVACDDNSCTAGRSRITFSAVSGQTFLIRLSNLVNTPAGTAVVSVSCTNTCPCNWNNDAFVNSQDFFDFLTGFFANNADYNNDGFTNSQDFFDFLTCFFNPGGFGC